jgi:hypothetical protein
MRLPFPRLTMQIEHCDRSFPGFKNTSDHWMFGRTEVFHFKLQVKNDFIAGSSGTIGPK